MALPLTQWKINTSFTSYKAWDTETRRQISDESQFLNQNVECYGKYKLDNVEEKVHIKSIQLQPVNDLDVVQFHFDRLSKIERMDWSSRGYRLLVNLKYRGDTVNGMVLVSDINNKSVQWPCPITIGASTNECIVFEYDIAAGEIRNYFYNASRRELVNLKRPSWVKSPDN